MTNNKNDHLFLDWLETEIDVNPSADGPPRLIISMLTIHDWSKTALNLEM